MTRYLAGIPAPFECESICSWVQRACQVYDLTFGRFHETFGTTIGPDPDLCFSPRDIQKLARITRLPLSKFSLMSDCFGRIADMPRLRPLLLSQPNRWPMYRYCPECWLGDHTPYLRLEWRFRHWKYCRIHRLELQERCPNCQKLLAMHRSILGGTTTPPPVLTLAHCLFCRVDVREMYRNERITVKRLADEQEIRYQRAIVSSVVHGFFFIEPLQTRRSLSELIPLLNGIGLEAPDQKSSAVLSRMEPHHLRNLEWVLDQACHGATWLKQGHPKRRVIARHLFDFLRFADVDDFPIHS